MASYSNSKKTCGTKAANSSALRTMTGVLMLLVCASISSCGGNEQPNYSVESTTTPGFKAGVLANGNIQLQWTALTQNREDATNILYAVLRKTENEDYQVLEVVANNQYLDTTAAENQSHSYQIIGDVTVTAESQISDGHAGIIADGLTVLTTQQSSAQNLPNLGAAQEETAAPDQPDTVPDQATTEPATNSNETTDNNSQQTNENSTETHTPIVAPPTPVDANTPKLIPVDTLIECSFDESTIYDHTVSSPADLSTLNGNIAPGEYVRIDGDFSSQTLTLNDQGSPGEPICVNAHGAHVRSMSLRNATHTEYHGLEISNDRTTNCINLVPLDSGSQHIKLVDLNIHDCYQGIVFNTNPSTPGGHEVGQDSIARGQNNDITVIRSTIEKTGHNCVLFNDNAGNRYHFFDSTIRDCGLLGQSTSAGFPHGIYTSGGWGHWFQGNNFSIANGNAFATIRRGCQTWLNNTISSTASALQIFNQDPANSNCNLIIANNHIIAGQDGIYHAAHIPTDGGVADSGNSHYLFNNRFTTNRPLVGDPTGNSDTTNYCVWNNVFTSSGNGYTRLKSPTANHSHVWSHNYYGGASAQFANGPHTSATEAIEPEESLTADKGTNSPCGSFNAEDYIQVIGSGLDYGIETY